MRVIVIGAGIVGLLCARALGRAGAEVTVLAGGGARASEGSLVWLNVCSAQDTGYALLRAASLARWADLGDAGWPVRFPGSLMWGDEMARAAPMMAAAGWPAEHIGANRFAELAPGVAEPPAEALFFPGEGMGDPAELLDHAAAEAGAVATRRRGRAVALRPGALDLADGTALQADRIVVAAGCG
ncbi:MAG: FAD-dependent oxidoreductase, partial [Pseudomonadota bacterium]